MDNTSTNNTPQASSGKLAAEIKKTFSKLSDADIALQATSPDKFYEAVKTKEGINKDEAEKTIQKLTAESNSAGNKPADSNAASTTVTPPKAANAETGAAPLPKTANA